LNIFHLLRGLIDLQFDGCRWSECGEVVCHDLTAPHGVAEPDSDVLIPP